MNRYLVIDDEDVSRLMLSSFLSDFAPCDNAVNGKEGLQLFEKALEEGNPYTLLCIDLMMPELNGLALIRMIRDLEKKVAVFSDFRTKIFVITASDSAWDKADLLLDNLCDDYIVKPFERTTLLALLEKNKLYNQSPG